MNKSLFKQALVVVEYALTFGLLFLLLSLQMSALVSFVRSLSARLSSTFLSVDAARFALVSLSSFIINNHLQ